jgi:hypothetical protein
MKYIKNFKLFENIDEGEPKKGDWVIIDTSHLNIYPDHNENEYKDKIGKIIRIRKHYDEIDIDFDGRKLHGFSLSKISHWSENREDLETLLDANKYNL